MIVPTPEQHAIAAALASGAPSILIHAGPGCGKTTTLTWLASQAPNPAAVLAVAFNRDIAAELTRRMPPPFKVATINALGNRAWLARPDASHPTINARKTSAILNTIAQGDRWTIAPDEREDLQGLISHAKAAGYLPPRSGAAVKPLAAFADVCASADVRPEPHYEALLNAALTLSIAQGFDSTIDFDDQLYLPWAFGTSLPTAELLLIDEAQDLTPVQLALLARIRAAQTVLVGDPHQAIYAFRGASASAWDDIPRLWPGIQTFPLQLSYRVPAALLPLLRERNPALHTASRELGSVITPEGPLTLSGLIGQIAGTAPTPGAILCRNNAPLFRLALLALSERLPFTLRGQSFGQALIRDINRACRPSATTAELLTALALLWHRPGDTPAQTAATADRLATITALAPYPTTTAAEISRTIAALLRATDRAALTLSTAHRAKGLEWPWVIHLDPHLIPQPWATGPSLAQEANIAYVINSRTRNVLTFVRSDQFSFKPSANQSARHRPVTCQDQTL